MSVGGTVLDASGIAISTADYSQLYPAISFDGTDYVVVWNDLRSGSSYDIYAAHVTPAGVVLDPGGIDISTAAGDQYYPCVGVGPVGQVLIGYGSLAAGGYNNHLIWGDMLGGYVGVEREEAPKAYRICQSYPNPFNPICTIRYDIAHAGRTGLRVFDVNGSVVRTLVDGWREAGTYSEIWNGRDDAGRALSSGVYFCRLESGVFVAMRKMVLLR